MSFNYQNATQTIGQNKFSDHSFMIHEYEKLMLISIENTSTKQPALFFRMIFFHFSNNSQRQAKVLISLCIFSHI